MPTFSEQYLVWFSIFTNCSGVKAWKTKFITIETKVETEYICSGYNCENSCDNKFHAEAFGLKILFKNCLEWTDCLLMGCRTIYSQSKQLSLKSKEDEWRSFEQYWFTLCACGLKSAFSRLGESTIDQASMMNDYNYHVWPVIPISFNINHKTRCDQQEKTSLGSESSSRANVRKQQFE